MVARRRQDGTVNHIARSRPSVRPSEPSVHRSRPSEQSIHHGCGPHTGHRKLPSELPRQQQSVRHCTADNRLRGETLSEARKAVLLLQWGKLPLDARGKKVGVGALEAEFGLARGYISNHLLPHVESLADGTTPFAMDISAREPRVYTPTKVAFMEEHGRGL